MAKQQPYEIINKAQKAYIKIVGEISWWKNGSEEFIRKVDDLLAEGITDLECYINTPGGSMFEANEIGNQIERFSGSRTCTLGAICASAGTLLSTYFEKITASKNTQYMIHDPIMRPTIERVKDWDSQKKLYENLRQDAISRYVDLTGISEDDIDDMMESVTWMNAKELKKKKFAHGIRNEKAKMPEDAKAVLNAYKIDLPDVINKAFESDAEEEDDEEEDDEPTNQAKSKTENMKDIAKKLGLPEDATEEQIANAISSLQAQAKFGVSALKVTAEAKGLPVDTVENIAKASFEDAVKLVNESKTPDAPKGDDDEGDDDEDPKNESKPSNTRIIDLLKELQNEGGQGGASSSKAWNDMTPEERIELEDKDPKAFEKLFNEAHKNIKNPKD